jgi:HEPN domain-containing protein
MDHAADTRVHSTSMSVALHSRLDADDVRRRAAHDAAIEERQRLFMSQFEATNADGWLYKGAALMRASLAVQRQLQLDGLTARTAREAAGWLTRPYRARLHLPALMLAAMAVEHALKGAIVAAAGGATGHDLVQLARRAKVKPASEMEAEALERGRLYIEELVQDATHARDLCPAYRALFLRAVDAAARAVWERNEHLQGVRRGEYAAEEVAVYRMFVEGVYAPAEGEEGLDLFCR